MHEMFVKAPPDQSPRIMYIVYSSYITYVLEFYLLLNVFLSAIGSNFLYKYVTDNVLDSFITRKDHKCITS